MSAAPSRTATTLIRTSCHQLLGMAFAHHDRAGHTQDAIGCHCTLRLCTGNGGSIDIVERAFNLHLVVGKLILEDFGAHHQPKVDILSLSTAYHGLDMNGLEHIERSGGAAFSHHLDIIKLGGDIVADCRYLDDE